MAPTTRVPVAGSRDPVSVKRRSNVVGLFPQPPALPRLAGVSLMEEDGEWAVADRRCSSAGSMRRLTRPLPPPTARELPTAIAWRRKKRGGCGNRGAVSEELVELRSASHADYGMSATRTLEIRAMNAMDVVTVIGAVAAILGAVFGYFNGREISEVRGQVVEVARTVTAHVNAPGLHK